MNYSPKLFITRACWVLLLAVLAVWAITRARSLPELPIFYHLFVRYDLTALVVLTILLLASLLLASKSGDSLVKNCLTFLSENPLKISICAFLLLSLGAYYVYFKYPLCMDEYMPYFQAQVFADGKLWGHFPRELVPWLLEPGFFSVFSTESGWVISDYWPGFALLLTPFMKIGFPWLLNPLISAGTLVLLFYYMKRIFPDGEAASWGVLLTLASSVFLVNGISYYSMSAHLFLSLLYAVLLLRITPTRLFLAGVVGSFALVLHNPVPHIAFALPWILWICTQKSRLRNMGILVAGYLPISLFMGLGWIWLKAYVSGGATALAANHGLSQPLSIWDQIKSFSANLGAFFPNLFQKTSNSTSAAFVLPSVEIVFARFLGILKLFAWSAPGLPILAIMGIKPSRFSTHLRLWGWSAIVTFVVYLFVPFDQGHGWGFRYFHSVWLVLPLLATAFLVSKDLTFAPFWKRFACFASLACLVVCTSLRFYQVHEFIGQHLSQLPPMEENGKYICIVKTNYGYYTPDLVQNDPYLRGNRLLLRSLGDDQDAKMMQRLFPEAVKIVKSNGSTLWRVKDLEIDLGKLQ